jgi:glycogen debranching enzyme
VPDLVRIRPRPQSVFIGRNRSVLATDLAGLIAGGPGHGFFVYETRLLSRWSYAIDGHAPLPNASSAVKQHQWGGYFITTPPGVTAPPQDEGSGQVPAESRQTLELRVMRVVDDGLHEDLDLTNYGSESTTFVLTIELDADFLDPADAGNGVTRGTCRRRDDDAASSVAFDFEAQHEGVRLRRSVEIRVLRSTTPPRFDASGISFAVTLEPHQRWHACIHVDASIDGTRLPAPGGCYDGSSDEGSHRSAIQSFLDDATGVEAALENTLSATVVATLEQARADLAALRLFDLDVERGWTVAAGLPLYVALFGRDTLTTGWQAGILGPEMMTGSLAALGRLQGTREDDWRDEQPGKMLHEAHSGPSSALGFNPRDRSYSSITTSGLYSFIAAELWHWTGDKDLVRPFIEPALRSLQWLERYGDADGDGFYEYQSRSPMGPVHQAWKDSPDAIVYEDGTAVQPPIATCEEQAFVYVAKLHLAEMLWSFGEHDLSRKLHGEAVELKKRFNDAFWMEDEGLFALALDRQKRPVRSIASNAGHCIAAAISDASLVERATDRLFAPDLFSGWGIRTLSSSHPRYNPYSYHLGSIWPVEQGTFAIGFWRYGLHERVQQLARAQFEAAELFEHHRLPELFGGHTRDERGPFPAIYPNANPLQAWSSSSVFALLQALLGLYPYAPLKLLVIDPHLPDWLPEITLRDLRVGKAVTSIHFQRTADGRTKYRVLKKDGTLRVVRQATPWSLTTQPASRLWDALESLLPHH